MDTTPTSSATPLEAVGSPQGVHIILRQQYREEAQRGGDDNQLWETVRSKCMSLNARFMTGTQTVQDLEPALRDLWYLFYYASINISSFSPCLDRLALQVVQTREQGVLTRQDTENGEAVAISALTSDGHIWSDMPYMIEDMTAYWREGHVTVSASQRLSYSTFLAKLASMGVGKDDGLCGIALLTIREALETPRILGSMQDQQQEENADRRPADLSIAAMLPSVLVWLSEAGLKIIQLSEQAWNFCPAQIGEPGELIKQHNDRYEDQHWRNIHAGFSTGRWIYWLSRLEAVANSAEESGQSDLAETTIAIINTMVSVLEQTKGQLTKDLESAYADGVVKHRSPASFGPPGSA